MVKCRLWWFWVNLDQTRPYNPVEMDPLSEIFGISWGSGRLCKFNDSGGSIGLTVGQLPSVHGILSEFNSFCEFDADNFQFLIRFTYTEQRTFTSYSS